MILFLSIDFYLLFFLLCGGLGDLGRVLHLEIEQCRVLVSRLHVFFIGYNHYYIEEIWISARLYRNIAKSRYRDAMQGLGGGTPLQLLGMRLKIMRQLLARKFERDSEILILRWSVEEEREEKVLLLLVFDVERRQQGLGRQSLAAVGGRNSAKGMHHNLTS
jgi:hypothetical protein